MHAQRQHRHPTPLQAWLAFERYGNGLTLGQEATRFEVSRSAMQRAERGGIQTGLKLADKIALASGVQIGSWPAADHTAVASVLHWWSQHPLDRLARCLGHRTSNWQTPIRHVVRQLMPLDAAVSGASCLDFLLPPHERPAPTEWTLLRPPGVQESRLWNRQLGVIRIGDEAGLGAPPGVVGRSIVIPDRFGQLPHGFERDRAVSLRFVHPRDLMLILGWSPGLAAAVAAADQAGPAALAGIGHPRRKVRPHHSMEVYEAFDDDEAGECGLGDLVEAGDHFGEDVGVGLGQDSVPEVEDVARR